MDSGWKWYAGFAVAVIAAIFAAGQFTIAYLDRRDAQPQRFAPPVLPDTSAQTQRLFVGDTLRICGGSASLTAEPFVEAGQPASGAYLSAGDPQVLVPVGGTFSVTDNCMVKVIDVGQTTRSFTDFVLYFED